MKEYNSKVSFGLILFLVIVFGLTAYMGVSLGEISWISLSVLGISAVFTIYTLWSIKYKIENAHLNVKNGFLVNQDIDISSIKKITETNTMISAPAASFDRLKINFNKYDSVIISPKNKKEFIHHLLSINPKIEVVLR